jgi:hypothetical protein
MVRSTTCEEKYVFGVFFLASMTPDTITALNPDVRRAPRAKTIMGASSVLL